MIALILRNDPAHATAATLALMDMGFQVVCVDNLQMAAGVVRGMPIDVVLCDEDMDPGLTHNLLLLVARRHPNACAFLLTQKQGVEADELFLLIPTIYALLPIDASIDMLTRLVRAGLEYAGDTAHKVAGECNDEELSDTWIAEEMDNSAQNVMALPTQKPDSNSAGSFLSVRTPVFH